jgi:hypothetical protein
MDLVRRKIWPCRWVISFCHVGPARVDCGVKRAWEGQHACDVLSSLRSLASWDTGA